MSVPPAQDDGVDVVRRGGGAELRMPLMPVAGPDSVNAALAFGFSSALTFDAGLACSADGRTLELTRWLADPNNADALRGAIASLRAQHAAWRALLDLDAPARQAPGRLADGRQQRRLLGLLTNRTSP